MLRLEVEHDGGIPLWSVKDLALMILNTRQVVQVLEREDRFEQKNSDARSSPALKCARSWPVDDSSYEASVGGRRLSKTEFN